MTRWLVTAVLLAPLAIAPATTGEPLAQVKNAAFVALAVGIVAWRCASPWLRAFAGLAAVSFALSGFHAWGLLGLGGITAFLLLHQESSRRSDAEWAVVRRAIAAAAGLQIVWMGVQALGVDPIFQGVTHDKYGAIVAMPAPIVGWFGNRSDTALFLGLSLPALVAVSPWLLVPAALALAALASTAGAACAAVTTVWLASRMRRSARVAALAGLVAAGALFLAHLDPQGLGHRPTGWAAAARLAAMRPVVGWGPNVLDSPHLRLANAATNERWNFFFNEWLQGAVELGVGGPLLAAGYLASLARRLRGRWAACGEALPAAVALLLTSLFSIPLRIGPTALLAALYLGRLEAVAARPATEAA